MSEILQSLILGIVQGLTEFLPVSSSGHLEITKFLLGDESLAEESLAMTVALHVATALSTVVVFRKEIASLIRDFSLDTQKGSLPYFFKIAITMVPAAFIGFFFEDKMAVLFDGKLLLVGFMLLITAALLFIADSIKRNHREVSYKDSIIIGLAQAFALLPGISRSGSTICTALIFNIKREEAARFSFLIVLPLILGKGILDVREMIQGNYVLMESGISLTVGFIAAFITGVIACKWMIALVKSANLKWFGIYCLVIGISLILYNTVL